MSDSAPFTVPKAPTPSNRFGLDYLQAARNLPNLPLPHGVGITDFHAHINGRLACPVMGDVVESAAESSGFADYEGVRYYFCCSSCADRFAQNPATFADGKFLRQEGIWSGGASDRG